MLIWPSSRGVHRRATDEPSLCRAASGGVILLDEVGEMPLTMQAKLLRVLQEGEITRLGTRAGRKSMCGCYPPLTVTSMQR